MKPVWVGRRALGLVLAVGLVHGWLATQVQLADAPRRQAPLPAIRLVTPTQVPTQAQAPLPVTPETVLKPNQPNAHVNSAQAAIGLIANKNPPVVMPDAPPARASTPPAPVQAATSAASSPAANDVSVQLPGSTRLTYDISGQTQHQAWDGGQAQLIWQHDGNQYQARMSWQMPDRGAAGVRRNSQTSVGRVVAGGLQPERFADRARSEQAAHFEPQLARVRFSANTPDAPWQPGTQDALSVWLQLASLLAANPGAYPTASQITLLTVTAREARDWVFLVEGPQSLSLPGGPVQTLKLSRLPQREYEAALQVWLATDMHYLPVRLRTEWPNGDYRDEQWRATDVP